MLNFSTIGANNEIGNLSLGIHLNRVRPEKELDLRNPQSLADYIKWEYEDYYETPEIGNHGKGQNYRYRTKYAKILAEQGEWYRDQYEVGLKSQLEPTPDNFDLKDFGGGLWTCFQLERPWHEFTIYYCIPLSDSYYLHIDIQFLFHITDKNRELLEPDMLRAAEWLVQHIKIAFPGKPGGPLALPH